MTDRFEQDLRDWLQERGTPDPVTLSSVAARIATLPGHRRSRGRWVLLAAAAVALVIGTALVAPRFMGPSTGPAGPTLPDPAAFADDPRLGVCRVTVAGLLTAFEMDHVSDYQRHLPNAYPLIGLDADPTAPALVLVHAGPSTGGRAPVIEPPTPSPSATEHDLCMIVGDDPASWASIAIARVDITGLVAVLPGTSSDPKPPDPAAFAGDPRLETCFGGAGPVEFAFVMPRARDYQRHFPAMLLAPELEVDDPGFVVVFAEGAELPMIGGPPGSSSGSERGSRAVCVLVGDTPNLYMGVDITGMRVDIGTTIASATPTAADVPSPVTSSGSTPEPAPNWVADLLGQLECRGAPQPIGGELGGVSLVGATGTASPYIWLYALDDEALPLEGWIESPKVDWESGASRFVRYINEMDGRTVGVIVMQAGIGTWSVVAYRACASSEFDPLRGRTTDDAPWLDADGMVSEGVRSNVGPAHCGWESTVLLHIDDRLYLRDPSGIFADRQVVPYLPDTALPADATATGLSSHERRLFITPDEDAVFVEDATGVERWPRSTDPIGCV